MTPAQGILDLDPKVGPKLGLPIQSIHNLQMRTNISQVDMGRSKNWGSLFGGSYNKDYIVLGGI